jgi:hypothetical protein
LGEWYGPDLDTAHLTETQIISLALERAIIGSHRHVFGVLFWFMMPMGPAGVVLYRLADIAAQRWSERGDFNLSEAARHFFYVLDWIPSRITAMGFAIVGNFEGAVYAWRYLTQKWADSLSAVILAAGGGGDCPRPAASRGCGGRRERRRSIRTPHRAWWWHRKGTQEPTHGGGAYATSTGFGGISP